MPALCSFRTGKDWSCKTDGTVKISGGNINATASIKIGTYENSNLVAYIPTNEQNNVYVTTVQLENVSSQNKITKLTTSDNINYGIKDMYTSENGMLYLYLPLGERTITIECDGKTYSGTVTTSENGSIPTLQEV